MTKVFLVEDGGREKRVTPGAEYIVFGPDDMAVGTVTELADGIRFTDSKGQSIDYFATKSLPVIRKTLGTTEFVIRL